MLRSELGTDTNHPDGVPVYDFCDEVYILDGAITGLRLDQTFTAGMYVGRPPGMPHGPWPSRNSPALPHGQLNNLQSSALSDSR
jgi:hypothetical protein